MAPFDDRATLLQWIETQPGLAALRDDVRERMSVDPDPGHDLDHALRVALWTVRLAPEVDRREAVAAALLHDVVNLPKNHPERASAGERSAALARELLPPLGFGAQATERVAAAIRDHGYSRGVVPESPLGRALQDADRLEALGALGLCRTLSTGARMGARYFHPQDPWAQDRELDDRAFTVDHFFTKLLRLAPTLQTEAGRAEAHRRAAFMERFLDQLREEIA
ncbi:MAG: phosphohydrolase [Sandaracinus sp.]|nr:phosphohydrolase [Sandaracinus sp.]|tara:strand:+ start:349 stop:1020 length:672 start_codon:yes stop_codon:yes gene_type:complete